MLLPRHTLSTESCPVTIAHFLAVLLDDVTLSQASNPIGAEISFDRCISIYDNRLRGNSFAPDSVQSQWRRSIDDREPVLIGTGRLIRRGIPIVRQDNGVFKGNPNT